MITHCSSPSFLRWQERFGIVRTLTDDRPGSAWNTTICPTYDKKEQESVGRHAPIDALFLSIIVRLTPPRPRDDKDRQT